MKYLGIFLLLLAVACNREEISATGPGIYISGLFSGGSGFTQAAYWKNQHLELWSPGIEGRHAELVDILVVESDIYAVGYEMSPTSGNNIAKLWKNGIGTDLTDGSFHAIAYSIHVSGEDVYVCGHEYNGIAAVAKYWKNGEAINLTDGTTDAYTNTIIHSGSDLYIAGQEGGKAKYWKNGIAVELSKGNEFGRTTSMVLQGTDIYFSGLSHNLDIDDQSVAVYWKNGILNKMTDGTRSAAAFSIFVSGSDVFVVGYENSTAGSAGFSMAKYWKNGNPVTLSVNSGSSSATSIVVDGMDIHIVGNIRSNGTTNAIYWKNETAIQLADPSINTFADRILLVK